MRSRKPASFVRGTAPIPLTIGDDHGLHASRPAVRPRCAWSAHVRGNTRIPSWQASQGLCRQGQWADRRHRPRRRLAGRGHPRRQPARRQAAVQQHRPDLEPQLLLAMPGAGRLDPAVRQAARDDRLGFRRRAAAARQAGQGKRQSFRQRMGLAGPQQRQARGHLAARCRYAGRARHDAAADDRCVGARLLHRLSQRAAEVT